MISQRSGHYAELAILLTVSGCASIIDGTMQTLTFVTEPPGAQIIIESMPMGVTPASLTLKRKDYTENATLVFKKEGYQDFGTTITTSLNGWFWGNIVTGGVFGTTTDSISGAMWEFETDKYFATLQPVKASQAEIDHWHYKNQVRRFVLLTHEQLASDLAKGEGEHLTSLYQLLNLKETELAEALVKLRAMVPPDDDPVGFSRAVLDQFVEG